MQSKDSAFSDPVVRCLTCAQLLFMDTVKKMGCCHKCGNKRVANVRTLTGDEIDVLSKKGVSPEWLSEFEEVADANLIE